MGQELKDLTLKDLIKPPFYHNGFFIYDSGIQLFTFNDIFRMAINNQELNCLFLDFVVSALNEKWERKLSEPLRWKVNNTTEDDFDCPKCGTGFYMATRFQDYNYCPNCGHPLKIPENK